MNRAPSGPPRTQEAGHKPNLGIQRGSHCQHCRAPIKCTSMRFFVRITRVRNLIVRISTMSAEIFQSLATHCWDLSEGQNKLTACTARDTLVTFAKWPWTSNWGIPVVGRWCSHARPHRLVRMNLFIYTRESRSEKRQRQHWSVHELILNCVSYPSSTEGLSSSLNRNEVKLTLWIV